MKFLILLGKTTSCRIKKNKGRHFQGRRLQKGSQKSKNTKNNEVNANFRNGQREKFKKK
jgi:hypothetical protein